MDPILSLDIWTRWHQKYSLQSSLQVCFCLMSVAIVLSNIYTKFSSAIIKILCYTTFHGELNWMKFRFGVAALKRLIKKFGIKIKGRVILKFSFFTIFWTNLLWRREVWTKMCGCVFTGSEGKKCRFSAYLINDWPLTVRIGLKRFC